MQAVLHTSKGVMEVQKEEAQGDWDKDEIRFIGCKGELHQPGSPHVEKSNQEGIRSSLNHAATASGQDPPTLADLHNCNCNTFPSFSSCSFHFHVQWHDRPSNGGGVAYEKR